METIRELLHAQYLHMRNCRNIVHSDNFQIAYELSNEEERHEVLLAIAEGHKEKIRDFILSKIKNDAEPFEQLSIAKLQEIAQHIGIPYYKDYQKLRLIEEIRKNVTERIEKSCE